MSTINIQNEQYDCRKEIADYRKKCAVISELNISYLKLFEADLQGLAQKTIKRHLQNIDFSLILI